jgi:hypothetical protein
LKELGALRDALRRRQAAAERPSKPSAPGWPASGAARGLRPRRGAGARAARPWPGRACRHAAPPEPLQRQADEREALRQALSDEVDVESLLLTDDGLSFRRPGVGPTWWRGCAAAIGASRARSTCMA